MAVQVARVCEHLLAFDPVRELNPPGMSVARSLSKILQRGCCCTEKFSPGPVLIGQDSMNRIRNPRQRATANVPNGCLQSLNFFKSNIAFFSAAAHKCFVCRTRFARGVRLADFFCRTLVCGYANKRVHIGKFGNRNKWTTEFGTTCRWKTPQELENRQKRHGGQRQFLLFAYRI